MALKTANPPKAATSRDILGAKIPKKIINHIKSGSVFASCPGPLTITADVNMATILKEIFEIPIAS
jgi:hypothetical protein